MKNFSPLLLLSLALSAGCAHNYVITLTSGTRLGAQGKPVLKGGSYYFKDATGVEKSISAGRVSQIETASSAARGNKSSYINSPSK